jgi:hypothetical protein
MISIFELISKLLNLKCLNKDTTDFIEWTPERVYKGLYCATNYGINMRCNNCHKILSSYIQKIIEKEYPDMCDMCKGFIHGSFRDKFHDLSIYSSIVRLDYHCKNIVKI